jgi:Tfp pilus assembly PilM family ATPase
VARFLALDAETPQFHLLSGTRTGLTTRLETALTWLEESTVTPTNAEAAGKRLREQLRTANVAPAPVLVCLGRERVILKDVKYPAVAAAEEAGLVRFQALKDITDAADDVVIDYQPLTTGTGEQRALAVVVRKEILTAYKRLCEAAGLKLLGIVPRPFVAPASVAPAARATIDAPSALLEGDATAPLAVLIRGDKWGEFTVSQAGKLLFARPIAGPALTNDTALRGELKRSLAVFAGQAGTPVQGLCLAEAHGGDAAQQQRLSDFLNVPVRTFDPLAGLDSKPAGPRGHFAGLAGALNCVDQLAVNLISPRAPKPQADPRKRQLLLVAALIGVLMLGAAAFGYLSLIAKDKRILELTQLKNDLDTTLAQLDLDAKRIKAVDEWVNKEVVWLDELYELTARMPNLERLRIASVVGEPLPATVKGKHAARLTLNGLATEDHRPLESLFSELVRDPFYRLEPKKTSRNATGIDRGRFPAAFEVRLDVEHRPTAKYLSRFTATPPERGRGGDMGNLLFGGF